MRKILIALTMALICATAACAATLPEIDGWTCGELRTTKLDTVSGNKGQWLERDYRTPEGVPLHAIWMEGSGEKRWFGPTENASGDDGAGATYRTLEINGNKAALDRHPVTGPSLAIRIPNKGTLTIESHNITSDEEMIKAGEQLAKEICK